MADTETTETTEETQDTTEATATEATETAEETEEKPPEAKAEGEEDPEGEEEDADAEAKPDGDKGRRQRPNGYQRLRAQLERSEREKEILLAQLGRAPAQPAPAAPDPKTLTPEQQLESYVDTRAEAKVQAALAAEREAVAQQATAQRWGAQLEEMEGDSRYGVENAISALKDPRSPYPKEVKEALLTSEHAPRIIASLLRNPVELARFDALPPLRRVLEIGRLEEKLSAGATSAKPPRTPTRAPAPPTRTGGSASTSSEDLDKLPIAEYKRRMRSGGR